MLGAQPESFTVFLRAQGAPARHGSDGLAVRLQWLGRGLLGLLGLLVLGVMLVWELGAVTSREGFKPS